MGQSDYGLMEFTSQQRQKSGQKSKQKLTERTLHSVEQIKRSKERPLNVGRKVNILMEIERLQTPQYQLRRSELHY